MMRPWFPNHASNRSPHSRLNNQQVLSGVVPFDPHEPDYGRLSRATVTHSGSTELMFTTALRAIPAGQDCFTESIQSVFILFRGEGAVTPPDEDWDVVELEARPGWPGVAFLLNSPPEFEGLTVTVGITGNALRVLSLNEWRGEGCPGSGEPDPGPGDPT